MKKLFITALTFASVLSAANAQEFKASKGNVTADLSLFTKGIFATESPVVLNGGMLKGRYFLSDDLAFRGAFNLTTKSNKDTSNEDLVKKESASQFGLRLGLEKHFAGTDHLSPYIGGELGMSYLSTSSSSEPKQGDKTKIEGPNTIGFGAGVFLGADYYIVKNVYLGVEAGLNFATNSVGSVKNTVGSNSTEGTKQGSVTGFSVGANAGFKLGFVF